MYKVKKMLLLFFAVKDDRQVAKFLQCPKYTSDLFKRNSCSYALRNSDFSIPRVNTVTFGKQSVSYFSPVIWSKRNSEVKQSETIYICF